MGIIETGRVIEGSGLGTPLRFAGAPTSAAGGTYAGTAAVGAILIDTTNGKEYICTAYVAGTNTITWTVVGTQV
jgi:hypothetical protein